MSVHAFPTPQNRSDRIAHAVEQDLEFTVLEDQETGRPLVPKGVYEAQYVGSEVKPFMGGRKLYAKFEIVTLGEHFGKILFRAYNYYGGRLKLGSDLYKDLAMLYGRKTRKNAKLSMALFKGKILEVRVRVVKRNRTQTELAEHQQYSVVDCIVRVAAGGAHAG